jgi:hypothetical protein
MKVGPSETEKRGTPAYRDIFTLDRRGKQPLILRDGTSVEFPDSWTQEQAETWRRYATLAKPAGWKNR